MDSLYYWIKGQKELMYEIELYELRKMFSRFKKIT